jgi:hypothetical protein
MTLHFSKTCIRNVVFHCTCQHIETFLDTRTYISKFVQPCGHLNVLKRVIFSHSLYFELPVKFLRNVTYTVYILCSFPCEIQISALYVNVRMIIELLNVIFRSFFVSSFLSLLIVAHLQLT